MRRREFIAGLGAAGWPIVVGAQPSEHTRRVGVFVFGIPGSQSGSGLQGGDAAPTLPDNLRSLGWIEGRNLQFVVRLTDDAKAVDAYADELVRLAPDVIVSSSYLATRALQQRTRGIPIVFAGMGDPIKGALVNNLARPEGNITGVTNLYSSIGGKWVTLLKHTDQSVARVGIVISLGSLGG